MYGSLTTICGPMFASKTTSLLKNILWAKNGTSRDVHVYKIAFDNRYSESEIVSHDGLKVSAISINTTISIENKGNTIVFFDEIQFFDKENFDGDIIIWITELLNKGIDVVVSGLDMDWKGNAFPIVATLFAMADEPIKLSANCTVCGQPARKTYKKTLSGGSVELGATDTYEARCNKHWKCY